MADSSSPTGADPPPATTTTTTTGSNNPASLPKSNTTPNKPSLPPNFKGIKFTRLKSSHDLPLNLRLRIQASKYMSKKDGSSDTIIPLSKTKILKLNTRRNELEAMEFVRANTTIPIPRVYEVYEFTSNSDNPPTSGKTTTSNKNNKIHLLMERLPNSPETWSSMSPEQVRSFGAQLADYMSQLRSLSPPSPSTSSPGSAPSPTPPPIICSISYGPLLDHRAGHIPFGPFFSLDQFHAHLRLGCLSNEWTLDPIVSLIHSKPSSSYKIVFTHADMSPSNLCISSSAQITGIIDWEFSGWYPEYWEYTKMYFAEGSPAYRKFFEAVEQTKGVRKYEEELKGERDIWRGISPWRYDDYYGDRAGGGGGEAEEKA